MQSQQRTANGVRWNALVAENTGGGKDTSDVERQIKISVGRVRKWRNTNGNDGVFLLRRKGTTRVRKLDSECWFGLVFHPYFGLETIRQPHPHLAH